MKLATLKNGIRDGRLVVVSRDLSRAAYVDAIASTMLEAIENWKEVESSLETIYNELNEGILENSFPFDPKKPWRPCRAVINLLMLPLF